MTIDVVQSEPGQFRTVGLVSVMSLPRVGELIKLEGYPTYEVLQVQHYARKVDRRVGWDVHSHDCCATVIVREQAS